MSYTTCDFIVQRLRDWGVNRIFGYPGDGINGLLAALRRSDRGIQFVQAREETTAAMMACAHAKFTGEVGVCLSTAGPGATQLLSGLYDAKLDHMPLLALVGQQPTISLGSSFLQELDIQSLYKDVAGAFCQTAVNPAHVRHLVDRAMRIAMAERAVTCIILPIDVQDAAAVPSPPHRRGATYSGIGYDRPKIIPTSDQLDHAANILNHGDRVAMLVGAGALGATVEVEKTADLLGAGVAKALLGKAVLPDDLSYVTGCIGLLGTRASWDMMQDCDTLLMIGSSFPYAQFLPPEGQARAVQIDINARNLGLRYPSEINLHGDTRMTLQALIPRLQYKTDRSWRQRIEQSIARWWNVVESRAMADAHPINPQRVFWELSSRLPQNCIITTDSGTCTTWTARDLKIRRGMMFSVSGRLATMGCAIPYALAAKLAYPDRPVIATVGDGAMQMSGNNELITVAAQCEQWSDPRFVVVVLNNRDLNFVTWEQRILVGDAKFEASQNLQDFRYADYAKMVGLDGIRVEHPNDIVGALEQAMHADRPMVLEFVTDPNVPPLPPHIQPEQALALAHSMIAGDPEAVGTLKQSMRQMIATWMPDGK